MSETVIGPVEKYLINGSYPNIIDLILQHLDFSDLMTLSHINSDYDSIILERIAFVIDFSKFADQTFESRPPRKYRHIKFFNDLKNLKNPEVFLTGNLQTIEFIDCRCPSNKIYKNIDKIQLDAVKKIDMTLTTFNPFVVNVLKKSVNLKELSLSQSTDEIHYLNELSIAKGYKFKLRKFKFSVFTDYNFRMKKPELSNVIRRHYPTLTELVLDVWIDVNIMKICFMLPKLNRLELYEMAKWNRGPENEMNWKSVAFIESVSIRYLKVQDLNNDVDLLGCVLDACPHLRILVLSKITSKTLNFIKKARKKKLSKNLIICDEFHESIREKK